MHIMAVITAYAWIHAQINDGYYYQKFLDECYNKRQNVANTPPLDEVELDDQYSFNDQLIQFIRRPAMFLGCQFNRFLGSYARTYFLRSRDGRGSKGQRHQIRCLH